MKIGKDSVVSFHYRLLDDTGELLEGSEGGEPTSYLHGHGDMLPGIEQALEGKEIGDTVETTLEKPYGPRHSDTIQRIPLKHLRAAQLPKPGTVVVVQAQHGPRQVTVVKVGKYSVDVDTNHPLAGFDLTYDMTVASVRVASAEEIESGLVLDGGGVNTP